MLFNNHELFLFSREESPSLDRARDTNRMKTAIKGKDEQNFGKCLPSFYHSKLCSKLFKKWNSKCLFMDFFLFIRKLRPRDTDKRMKVSIKAKMSGTWGSLCPDYWPQTRHPTTLRELATASKKESTRKALEETQVSAKSVHRKHRFTWHLLQMYIVQILGIFCKCTLFKHEIEEASEQLGATTGWITTNVGHKVRRIKALNIMCTAFLWLDTSTLELRQVLSLSILCTCALATAGQWTLLSCILS